MSEIRVDTISEKTSANGVSIDSLAIKDGKITNLMNATLSAADLGTGVHIKTADSGAGVNANGDELVIEGSGNAGMSILAGASSKSNIFLGDSGSSAIGNISYDHSDNSLSIGVSGAENFKILSTGATTITTADNTNTLSLVSTDADANAGPNLRLYRNSGSPADNDILGNIDFSGRNDNSEDIKYGYIEMNITDASDGSEDGYMSFNVIQAGATNPFFQMKTGDAPVLVVNENSKDMDFRVESDGVANMFFVDGGNSEVQASNTGSFYDTDRVFSARQNNNNAGICHFSTAPSDYANEMITIAGNREESTAEEFIRMNDSNDQQIIFRGDGNGFFDGAADAGNADFAEYFESTDGSVIAIGKTVVLDNGKVRASTDSDNAADIVGVVRHRKTVGVVGNSAWSKWKGKYKVDDYGVPEYEDYTVTKWTEEFTEDAEPLVITYNRETHNHSRIKGGKIDHSYQSDKIPSNLTVPDDAVVVNKDPKGNDLKRKILNDDYDASKEYVSREFRDEWNLIGLTGQVTMTKGQKTGDRWIKMRDISDSVEEWLVR